MRLSVITDEIDQDLGRALDVCGDLGLDLVELRFIHGVNVVDLAEVELRSLRAELDARGTRVCAVASPFLKCDRGDPGQQDVNARAIAAALILGAPIVRAFSYWREPDPAAALPELGAALREAAARCAALGLTLALENEHDCNVGSSAETQAALAATTAPELRVIWDPGNAAKLDSAGFSGLGGLESIYGSVAHIHLKDVDADGNWVRIGDGIVDFSALIEFLRDRTYDGVLSFETHYQRDGSGEAATRDCVASFQELLR